MDTKKDIGSRKDIEQLLIAFYEKVKADELIGFIFTDIAKINWEEHIPVIVDFWETILLDNPVYKKNAMEVHYSLNKKIALQPKHFERWLSLFNSTVDDMLEGDIALTAKTRAKAIADVMQFKMQNTNPKNIL